MRILIISDAHENMGDLEAILKHEHDVGCILNLGDLKNDRNPDLAADYGYTDYGVPMYFVKGNHEVEKIIVGLERGFFRIPNLLMIKPGDVVRLNNEGRLIRIAGLGGNYSPNWYNLKKKDAPITGFVEEDVQKCKGLGADIFLSHECPVALGLQERGHNVGLQVIDEVIKSIMPAIAFSGHHHEYAENMLAVGDKEVRLFGLEQLKDGYMVLNQVEGRYVIERKRR